MITPSAVIRPAANHNVRCLRLSEDERKLLFAFEKVNVIKVWDLDEAAESECIATLKGHKSKVISLEFYEGTEKVISCSSDWTIKVWSTAEEKCIATLAGHTADVWSMHRFGDMLATVSFDKTGRIWNLINFECTAELAGHSDLALCVLYHSHDLVITGSSDKTVKLWINPEEKNQAVKTLEGHTKEVTSLQFDGHLLISGSWDRTIRVWDANQNWSCRHTLTGHNGGVLMTKLVVQDHHDGRKILVSGSGDCSLRVWDVENGKCLSLLWGDKTQRHKSSINDMHCDQNYVYSCSGDGTLKLWDINTGEFIKNILDLETNGVRGKAYYLAGGKKKLVCGVQGAPKLINDTRIMVYDLVV